MGVWMGSWSSHLKESVFQPWDSDFRICFYLPAWLLYWPEYIWGYFSSSKVIRRQPLHLPKELLVGSMDWLIVGLTRMLHDSLCSIDAPKHVYHCVCCSKVTVISHLCKYSCKKMMHGQPSLPWSVDREHTPSGLTRPRGTHTLFWISVLIFKPGKKGRELQMNSHYQQNQASLSPKLLCVLSLWTAEAPASSVASWKIKKVSSSFSKQADSEPSVFVRDLIQTVSASSEIQRERKSVWYNFEIFSKRHGKE